MNPCVWFVPVLCWKMTSGNLYLTQSDGAGGRLCVSAPQELRGKRGLVGKHQKVKIISNQFLHA